MEFSRRHSAVESCPRPGVRQHGRAQAGGDVVLRCRIARGDGVGGQSSRGRVQRGSRLRRDGRRSAAAFTRRRGGELHGIGKDRISCRRDCRRAQYPLSNGDGRKERRDRDARRRHLAGGIAHSGRCDALCRPEVHGDEPSRRCARGRRPLPRGVASSGRESGTRPRDRRECGSRPGDQRAVARVDSPDARGV